MTPLRRTAAVLVLAALVSGSAAASDSSVTLNPAVTVAVDANASRHPDRAAHGNWDYLPWLLDQLHQYELQNGKRLLDVFSVHYYPQGGEFSNDTSMTMTLRRASLGRSRAQAS